MITMMMIIMMITAVMMRVINGYDVDEEEDEDK